MAPHLPTLLEKVQRLRERMAIQQEQVAVLQELWGSLFPYDGFEVSGTQYLVWLRRYDFDIIIASFERCLDWMSQENQAIEEGIVGVKPVTKLSLVKYASKVMGLKKAEDEVKAKRAR